MGDFSGLSHKWVPQIIMLLLCTQDPQFPGPTGSVLITLTLAMCRLMGVLENGLLNPAQQLILAGPDTYTLQASVPSF